MAVELKIPTAGESITEVQIGAWLKAEGDYVERDEFVVEIETDKASMELPAPVSGILRGVRHKPGDIVPVGSVIAEIEAAERPASAGTEKAERAAQAHAKAGDGQRAATATATVAPSTGETRIMPAARRVLEQKGVNATDVAPTGPGGRLLKEDVERHIASAPAAGSAPAHAASAPAPAPGTSFAGDQPPRHEEAVPMTMLRRRIAQRLVESQQTAALLTTFNEIDLSAVLRLREQRGDDFQKRYGIKLGFMSFFVKAAIDALKQVPAANAEIRGNDIVYKNYYDIGIAVSTEQGLVVPVVRNAERLSFAEVEQAIADLAQRARDRKITIEELQGGTFTITNGGVFGSLMSTPIVNPPQSAILGLHAIKDRPVAVNDQVVIRPMMYVAVTYDHRIIDGRESVTFLRRIKDCIEDPTRILLES